MESFFTFLNTGALLGWSIVLTILILHQQTPLSTSTINEWVDPFFDVSSDGRIPLIDLLFFLEALCCFEVTRIAIGQLKGNLILGIVLHMIRITCLLLVLPNGLTSSITSGDDNGYNNHMYNNPKFFTSILVLYSWSLTEVGRYPMYLFPKSNIARNVRLVLPMITFPIGCAAEAYGAYTVLIELLTISDDGNNSDNASEGSMLYWVKIASLCMVLLINGLLGPTLAYPALLKKGMKVVMGNKSKKQKEKKDA